jgi:endogenous inhibitor of DNA gyrase (YacG/DUF329 family)
MADLDRWFTEEYRVPVKEREELPPELDEV